ncbi:hypothetical protein COT77_01570 [Candidatus Berkelbacteria bacterium CG10_big_fil_rev_8_21_14_0_10_41_12]|uniref:TraC-like domain-containing protein n=1 Tax=Candidatus Berkelbacteria bacterium CG10_big_fil_rev_8_21_14_0_10_41_12 TaxID=1974513 RepID=A0A2M6WXA0_9BACT|nr:MAG: hypothetical protein COT77_01570 [Candidatus Berkelbacteria bacterium CG10_big_fil_rev_8_21_14_0_10_41_12]
MAKNQAQNKTQQSLPFSAIYNDVIVTKSGQFSMILMVNSVNFGLKSEDEQNSIIYQYQSFLNSLTFSIEIVMQSKQLDLTNYLKDLQGRIAQEQNELIRYQIQEYIDFVKKLISIANIMDKKFFIVIPYKPTEAQSSGGIFADLFGMKNVHLQVPLRKFLTIKEDLTKRVNTVQSGLTSAGLTTEILNTKQIIELFYRTYNPDESTGEKIATEGETIGASVKKTVGKGGDDGSEAR